jgi:hypothetical protein
MGKIALRKRTVVFTVSSKAAPGVGSIAEQGLEASRAVVYRGA